MSDVPHLLNLLFAFALGSCIGSFLNVVVWRLPQVLPQEREGLFRYFFRSFRALAHPPSHCPQCGKPLKWYDNLPVIGWIKLAGRCRFCNEPISIRYPIVEAITGLLFAFYYAMFFMGGFGPGLPWHLPDGTLQYSSGNLQIFTHWPIYLLDMMLISALIAASIIDAERFIIPIQIPWFVVPFALVVHALCDRTGWPGALNPSAPGAALAAGGAIGFFISLWLSSRGLIPASFAEGAPMMEVEKTQFKESKQSGKPVALDHEAKEYTPREVRREMRKEMLFLFSPMALGIVWVLLTWKIVPIHNWWISVTRIGWVGGLLGSVLGLLIGGFVVWIVRILGSYSFGREAMGLGDVDLMAMVGAVLGPGAVTVAFFISPFFGIIHGVYRWLFKKSREVPYGPYLSLGAAMTMLFYRQIANELSPGFSGIGQLISQWLGWS